MTSRRPLLDANPVPQRMRGLPDVTLDVHGTSVRVLNTHFDYRADAAVRIAQVEEILNYLVRERNGDDCLR